MTVTATPPPPAAKDEKKKEEPKQKSSDSIRIVKLVLGMCKKGIGGELFHDANGDTYLYAPVVLKDDKISYFETYALKGGACREFMRRAYFNHCGRTASGSALRDAAETLSGSAAVREMHPVYTRLASFDDRVIIDLGTEDRRVVIVTALEWTIAPCPPDVRMLRPAGSGMRPLPMPERGEAPLVELIPRILNVHTDDLDNMYLLIGWWIVSLRGKGPFLVLVLRGGSGSAKSNGLLIARGLVDPNSASKNHVPRDPRDLVIAVQNCYMLSIDNVSHLNEEIADAICVLATGGGLRTRRLHTDSDEAIFNKKAPVVMNGIPDVLGRADLAARAVVVELQPISESQRKTETEIEALKTEVMPLIFGRLLDALQGVLSLEGSTRPVNLPRMADVAVLLTAAEPSLGLEPETFINLLRRQADDAADAVLESNEDLLPPILHVTENATVAWEGELKDLVGAMPPSEDSRKPWTTKRLANALRRLSESLLRVNIRVVPPSWRTKLDGTHPEKRLWRFEPANVVSGETSVEPKPPTDDLPF